MKAYKNELKNFPVGTYADCVDASSDAYSFLRKLYYRGPVIKSSSQANVLAWNQFAAKFGEQIPAHWEVAGALRFANDSSKPSGWAIVTRAAENADLGEAVFVIAASRRFVDDPNVILCDFKNALRRYCSNGISQAHIIWLGKDSADVIQLAAEKHDLSLCRFEDDAGAGLHETNWYFQKLKTESPFYPSHGNFHPASRCYLLVDDRQVDVPQDDKGLLSTRQELMNWSYNEKGEPQPYGGVTLDCIRRCLSNFALTASPLTKEEKRIAQLPDDLKPESLRALLGTPAFIDAHWAQKHALNQIRRKEEETERKQVKPFGRFFGRPVQHQKYLRRRR